MVWRQVAGRYHTRVFAEWRRQHQIVTLLVPPPAEAVVPVDVVRPRPASATVKKPRPPSAGAAAISLQHGAVPVEVVQRVNPLYSKTDGRWRFGRMPASSVSDTAAASALPVTIHKLPTDA